MELTIKQLKQHG
jgi:hypothetical protein